MNERQEEVLRERIDDTRARMEQTIEQIGDRVNPDRVKADLKARAREEVDEVKNNVKRKARNTMRRVEHGVTDTGRGIWATIRENPLPAGMVGVGIAWLVANRKSGGESGFESESDVSRRERFRAEPYRTGYGEPSYDEVYTRTTRMETVYGEGSDVRSGAGWSGTAGGATWSGDGGGEERGIREKASDAVHEATDRVSEVAHDAQERASSVAHQAKDRARDAERRLESSMHEHPVAAGAIALAIGMAAGLMVPESDREHRMMGRTRERVMDKAEDAARRAGSKLHDAARDAAGESARHMVDEVWPGADSESSTEGFTEPRRM